jgi:hypothetical protein
MILIYGNYLTYLYYVAGTQFRGEHTAKNVCKITGLYGKCIIGILLQRVNFDRSGDSKLECDAM